MVSFQPWSPSPGKRGSTDILWSCVSTLGLCVWTAVHPNVPLVYRLRRAVCHRLGLMALAIIFPEIIISEALNQRLLARRLMQEVNSANTQVVCHDTLFYCPCTMPFFMYLLPTDIPIDTNITHDPRVRPMESPFKYSSSTWCIKWLYQAFLGYRTSYVCCNGWIRHNNTLY